jgi:polar amino acid transport system substrate-binding protein
MTTTLIRTRRFLQIAGLAAAGLLLAACGKKEAPAPAAPTPVASAPAPAKVYVVGTDAAYAPFESQNEKGEIVGFDIEVTQAIAQKAGIEVKFVNTPWEGIFNALGQGDRDMVVSAVTINDERKQTMDFTDPYFDAQQLIAVRENSKVAKFADLKRLKVGVQTGTTGDEAVTKLLGKTNTNIKRFESTPLALKELESGGVDAVVADNGVVIHYVANNPGGKFKTVADAEFVPEQYGIAVKKGNTELLAKLNKGLADIKADGTYDRIYAKYFGQAPAAGGAAAAPASAASR